MSYKTSPSLTFSLGVAAITLVSAALWTTQDAEACQPEPSKGYIVNTLPPDGGTTGTTHPRLDLIPPIALRWSGSAPTSSSEFFYLFGGGGGELDPGEPVASSFEVFAGGSTTPLSGEMVQQASEVRWVPNTALQPNTSYRALVKFRDGDEHSWTFTSTGDASYMEMPFPFDGIRSTKLKEKAHPTYTYCDVDFNDPDFTCYPQRRQSGWDYRPALYIEFKAEDSQEHGPGLYRYALYHHSSSQDLPGELVRYVDVTSAGLQTIEIERPEKVDDMYCYSLHHLYAYRAPHQVVERSEVVCHQASDLIPLSPLAPPDTVPLACEKGDKDSSDMDSSDMGSTGGQEEMGKGWMLNEQAPEETSEEGCGCASSPGGVPDSGSLALIGVGLLGGAWRRRRRA